jgi:hypothetical protein
MGSCWNQVLRPGAVPTFDHLAVVCCTPYNAVCWLVPDGRAVRVPGLRLQEQIGGTYLLRHLVCGTSMSVTAQPSTRPDPGDRYGNGRDRLWSTTPVTSAEWDLLESLPSVTPAAEALLAGLLVRLCLRDPAAGWATGQFSDDPLGRLERGVPRQGFRQLWGAGNRWSWRGVRTPSPAIWSRRWWIPSWVSLARTRLRSGKGGTSDLRIPCWRCVRGRDNGGRRRGCCLASDQSVSKVTA